MADDYNPFELGRQQESDQVQPQQQEPFGQNQQSYQDQQPYESQQPYQDQQPYENQQPYPGQQYYQGQQPYPGQQPYGQSYYANGQIPGKGKATAAMVLGIIGVIFAFVSPFVGLICSIIAVVMAGRARREGYAGGAAKAGKILGIIGIILAVAFFVLAVIVGVAIFNSPEVQQELQNLLNQ